MNRAMRAWERGEREEWGAVECTCVRCGRESLNLDRHKHCEPCADTVDAWEEAARWGEYQRDLAAAAAVEAAPAANDGPSDEERYPDECPTCEGEGSVRASCLGPDAIDDHTFCPHCLGTGRVRLAAKVA